MVLPGGRPKEESPRFPGDVARDLVHLGARLHVLGRIRSANVVGDCDRPRMVFAFCVDGRGSAIRLAVGVWRLGFPLPGNDGSTARLGGCWHAPPPLSPPCPPPGMGEGYGAKEVKRSEGSADRQSAKLPRRNYRSETTAVLPKDARATTPPQPRSVCGTRAGDRAGRDATGWSEARRRVESRSPYRKAPTRPARGSR